MKIITNKNNTCVERETRLNSRNISYNAGQNFSSVWVLHEILQIKILKCHNCMFHFISVKFGGNSLYWMSAAYKL